MPTLHCALDLAWLDRYVSLVVTELNAIVDDLHARGAALSALERYATTHPSIDWIQETCDGGASAAAAWRALFFDGMRDLATKLKAAYTRLTDPAAQPRAIDGVQKELDAIVTIWTGAANETEKYVEQFSDWGTLEMQRQLAFRAGRHHTNFDPIQLLFATKIHQEFSPQIHQEHSRPPLESLVLEALDVLLATQEVSGHYRSEGSRQEV
jgi:hypothetical protein